MLALEVVEEAKEQIRGEVYGGLDYQVHASWIRGMASGGGWREGQGRQSSVRGRRYALRGEDGHGVAGAGVCVRERSEV